MKLMMCEGGENSEQGVFTENTGNGPHSPLLFWEQHLDPGFISDRWNNEHFHFILCPFLCSNFQLKTGASFITEKTSVSKEDDACTLSRGRLFVTPWTVAHQAPLSKGISQ